MENHKPKRLKITILWRQIYSQLLRLFIGFAEWVITDSEHGINILVGGNNTDHSFSQAAVVFYRACKTVLDQWCTDDFIVIHRFPLTVTLFSCSIYCSFPVKFNFGCWLPLIEPYIELMLQRLCISYLLQRSNGFFNWHILLKTFF